MIKNVGFGQYYPVESAVHRMDPRIKILLSVILIVTVFFVQSFTGYGIIALFILVAVSFSRIKITSLLRSIKAILFLIIFTAVINLFFNQTGTPVLQWWIIRITDSGLRFTGMMALRLLFLVLGTSILTLTTTPIELTDGIESLLSPLKLIKFPVHDVAVIMSIALRMVPTLMEETDKIMMAQKARGADFESGNIFKRIKALIPVLIPLFVSAFRRADELSYAMDARCYHSGKGRTRRKIMKLHFVDFFAFFLLVAFFAGIIILNAHFAYLP